MRDAEDVAERVDHRRGDEPAAVPGERLVLGGPEREQAREGAGQVDMPVSGAR
ncbi:hypothetical protein GCM10023199_27100 [Actinomycetospora chibensis]